MEAISGHLPLSVILPQMSAGENKRKKTIRTGTGKRVWPACCFPFLLLFHGMAAGGEQLPELKAEQPGAILGAIHSEKIRAIMRRLNSLAYEREYTELRIQQMRAEQIELLVQTAGELARSAGKLPEITAQDRLGEEEQTTFRAMAAQLHRETLKLREYAQNRQYGEMARGYQRLHRTCNACHELFRER